MKRTDYISWDEYFMGVSLLAAKRSKDPNTQVGACIVNQDHIIISTGYNGFPKNCSDDVFPWERTGKDTKLEMRDPESIAVKQYAIYKQAAGVVSLKRLLNQSILKSWSSKMIKKSLEAYFFTLKNKIVFCKKQF